MRNVQTQRDAPYANMKTQKDAEDRQKSRLKERRRGGRGEQTGE